MLLAKVNPSAKIVKKAETVFSDPQIVNADYMSAIARPYVLGTKSNVRFEVNFGAAKKNDKDEIVGFERLESSTVELSQEEMTGWGVDDSIILKKIAEKLSTKVEETVEVDVKNPF